MRSPRPKPTATGNSSASPAKKTIHEERRLAPSSVGPRRPNTRSAYAAAASGASAAAGHPTSTTSGRARYQPTQPTLPRTSTPDRSSASARTVSAPARKTAKSIIAIPASSRRTCALSMGCRSPRRGHGALRRLLDQLRFAFEELRVDLAGHEARVVHDAAEERDRRRHALDDEAVERDPHAR